MQITTLRKKKGEVVARFFPKQTAAGEVLSAPTFTGSSSCGCIAMGGLLTCVAGAMMRPTGCRGAHQLLESQVKDRMDSESIFIEIY